MIMASNGRRCTGIPLNKITVKMGDSSFPSAPVLVRRISKQPQANPAVLAAGENCEKISAISLLIQDQN